MPAFLQRIFGVVDPLLSLVEIDIRGEFHDRNHDVRFLRNLRHEHIILPSTIGQFQRFINIPAVAA